MVTKYLPSNGASQKLAAPKAAQTASKASESLLIILSACINNGRASDCGFCQTPDHGIA
jgi:hypothetical protein